MDLTTQDKLSVLHDITQYNLTIRAGLDGLLFYATKEDTGDVTLYNEFLFITEKENLLLRKIREIFSAHPDVRQKFRTVTVYLSDPAFALFPGNLFSGRAAVFTLSGGNKPAEDKETIVMQLSQHNALLVFSPNRNLTRFFADTFPGCIISHEMCRIMQQPEVSSESCLMFSVHSSWFFCALFNNGQLEMVNSCPFRDDADLLFYVLSYTGEFLHNDRQVFIAGWGDGFERKYMLIKKYLPAALKMQIFPEKNNSALSIEKPQAAV